MNESDQISTWSQQQWTEYLGRTFPDDPAYAGSVTRVSVLTGGVSGVCILLHTETGRLVAKQALPKLRTAVDWWAPPTRILNEAAGLRIASTLTPGAAPALLNVDPNRLILLMEAAAGDHHTYKEQLLGADPCAARITETADFLGTTLATWHRETRDSRTLRSAGLDSDDIDTMERLRIGPFHQRLLTLYPRLRSPLGTCIDQLREQRVCFVHGDFSPKNVLVSRRACWVLDFEVGHRGAPVFDRAFLHCHLLLKAAHRPEHSYALRAAAERFDSRYREGNDIGGAEILLGWQTAALLLARVDGTSPVEYLDPKTQATVREIAVHALSAEPDDWNALWASLAERQSRS